MNRTEILNHIQRDVVSLMAKNQSCARYIPLHQKPSPSVAELKQVMDLLRRIIFPGFFGTEKEAQAGSIEYYIGVYLEQVYDLLQEQIYRGLCFENDREEEAKK